MKYYLAEDGDIMKVSGQAYVHTGMYFDST